MRWTNKVTLEYLYHNEFILFCFFVVFFQPIMLWNRVPFNIFFTALQMVVCSVVLLSSVIRIKKWDMYLWVWTIFCFIQIAVICNNNSVNGADSKEAIAKVLSYLFLVHFMDIFFSDCGKKEMLFFWKYLLIMLILEAVSIPLYHLGIISIYWLGIKTRATETVIAFLLITLLLKGKLKKRVFYAAIVLSVGIIIFLKISTGLLGVIMIALCLWLLRRKGLKCFFKLLQPSIIIVSILLLTIGVVFFGIQKHFASLFGFLFSKEISFSGRTWFWPYGIDMLNKYDEVHRLWGYGFYNIRLWCSWKWIDVTSEAHNQLLQMLHDTGIIGTVMLYACWFLQLRGLNKCKNDIFRNTIASICFVFFIMCIVEIYCYHSYFFIVLAIAAKSKNIAENMKLH